MNPFAIGYMVNHELNDNKFFRDQVVKLLNETFHLSTLSGI